MKKYLYLILFFLVCVPAIAGTINSYTLKSPPDDADTLVIYDSDDGSTKKIEVGDISGSGSGINWSSYPDLTALTSAQEFLINNAGTSSSINWEVVQTQLPSSGWTDGGTNVYQTTTTDTVGIGTTTTNGATLEIVKQGSTSPFKISSETNGNGNLLRVTSGGNVGISTTATSYKLNVYGGSAALVRAVRNDASGSGNSAIVTIGVDDGAPMSQGDALGQIYLSGASTSANNFLNGSSVVAFATEDWGASNAGSRLSFQTVSNGNNALVTRMSVDQSGNVGVGSTVPGAKLDVQGGIRAFIATSTVTVKTGANVACNTTCAGTMNIWAQNTADMTMVAPTDAAADVCGCLGP